MSKYIIGTGWWCDGSGKHPRGSRKIEKTCDFIRSRDFFEVWHRFIDTYTTPEKIIVIDSDSPVKPELPDDGRIEFVSLKENFGHAYHANRIGRRSGWSRSVLGGAFYSYLNDADYFVYVEQDCLVRGAGWIEACLRALKKGSIMFGDGEGTPQTIQQSLVIIHNSFIPVFINRLVKEFDKSMKVIASRSSDGNWETGTKGLFGRKNIAFKDHTPESRWHRAFRKDADYIPFGYGRSRPIDFDAEHLYAQHWTKDELETLFDLEGCSDFKEKLMKEF